MAKKYEKYKDSGVEWLGEIPEHWEVRKLKYCVNLDNNQANIKVSKKYALKKYIGLENIESWSGKLLENIEGIQPEGVCRVFNEGDVLFSKLRPYLAKAFLADFSGICTSELLVFQEKNFFKKKYLLNTILNGIFIDLVDSSTYGSKMPRANWDFIGSVFVAMPSLSEQEKISTYLDKKSEAIDKFIKNKEELIKLLEEEKKAIINKVLTKGVNQTIELKNSGVEWIGNIPKHWEVRKVRFLLKNGYTGIKIGPFGSAIKLDEMVEDGYKVYGQENVIKNDFSVGKRFLSHKKYKYMLTYKTDSQDILMTMMGTHGKCQVVPYSIKEGIIDSHLIRLRPSSLITPHFFQIQINDSQYVKDQVEVMTKGSIMSGLNSSIIKNIILCVPPIKEQQEIISYLAQETKKIDELKAKYRQEIDLIKEYKERLIYDVVTGKMSVLEH